MQESDIVPVDRETIAEDKFKKWMTRVQLLEKEVSTEDPMIVERVMKVVDNEEKTLPSWIKTQNAKLGNLVSSSTDVKINLRHIAIPSAYDHFTSFKRDIECDIDKIEIHRGSSSSSSLQSSFLPDIMSDVSQHPSSIQHTAKSTTIIKAENCIPIHTGPVLVSDRNTTQKFFTLLSNGNRDSLVKICDLADSHYRFKRADGRDAENIQRWRKRETERMELSDIVIAERSRHIKNLSGNGADIVLRQY